MRKFLTYSLRAAGVLIAIAVAGIIYIAITFNPNDYKAHIIKLVKDTQHRNLKLDGDIKLVLFPDIGADIGKASLSEFQSDKEFVYIDNAHISLALSPLLSRQIVAHEISISGLKMILVKFKNGKFNIDDLLPNNETIKEKTLFEFDIASIHATDSKLTYLDETSAAQYVLKDFNLNTGRIANGIPAKIDFSTILQSNQPKLELATQMKSTLTFDLKKNQFQMDGLELQAKGVALDINNLSVLAKGNINANFGTQLFSAKQLKVTATGIYEKNNFDAKLDIPALNLAQNNFTSDTLSLNAKLDSTFGNITANLALLDLTSDLQSFKSSALALDLDIEQPEHTFKIKLGSPIIGNIKQQQLNLPKLAFAVNMTGDKLPNKSVSSELEGDVQIDGSRQNIQTNLAGRLLQSNVKTNVTMNGFQSPALHFDIEVNQFDADQYLPKQTANIANNSAQKGQQFDLADLKNMNIEGGLRIGSLKIANVKLSQIRLDVKAHNGLVTISPLSSNLRRGSLQANASTASHTGIKPNLTP